MKQCVHTHMSHSCKLESNKVTSAMKFTVLQRDSLLALIAATTGDTVASCNQTNSTVLRNTSFLASQPGAECRNESQMIFSVQEKTLSVCFSSFNFTVIICSANEGMVGKIHIVSSTGVVIPCRNHIYSDRKTQYIVIPTQGSTIIMVNNVFTFPCQIAKCSQQYRYTFCLFAKARIYIITLACLYQLLHFIIIFYRAVDVYIYYIARQGK